MATQPETVSGALVTAWLAASSVTALCPSLWLDEVPEEDGSGNPIQTPFAKVEVIEEVPEWTTENEWMDVCQVKVSIYAKSASLADQIAFAFESVQDWQPLPFATARTVQVMRTKTSIGSDQWQDPRTHERVFERFVDYQIMVTRGTGSQ